MFDYLQKFNNLPKDLRDRISSPSVMAALAELENKYRVDLAMIVMKMMIKELSVKSLPPYFISEFDLSPLTAENLARELQDKVLATVADYLGFVAGKSVISAKNLSEVEIFSPAGSKSLAPKQTAPLVRKKRSLDIEKDIDLLIKEAGLVLPSEAYVGRLKNILVTYLRGIRSKIDARAALAKDLEIGGLNLTAPEIDRIFKVCDNQGCRLPESGGSATLRPPAAATRLDKIIEKAEKMPGTGGRSAEYDLKRAIASGQTKSPAALDSKHELSAPEKQLDLPRPAPASDLAAKEQKSTVKNIPSAPPKSAVASPQSTVVRPMAAVRPITVVRPMAAASSIAAVRPTAASRPAPAPSAAKPQMHDIKPMPKVMGPIEELQFLDLINFRRLGKTPAEITAKIFAKIKLLEKDGYDKMVAGVRAWRASPVNRLYLRLGQEAIAKGLPLKEAIALRQKADQGYLNLEEIEAIVNLNGRLAF